MTSSLQTDCHCQSHNVICQCPFVSSKQTIDGTGNRKNICERKSIISLAIQEWTRERRRKCDMRHKCPNDTHTWQSVVWPFLWHFPSHTLSLERDCLLSPVPVESVTSIAMKCKLDVVQRYSVHSRFRLRILQPSWLYKHTPFSCCCFCLFTLYPVPIHPSITVKVEDGTHLCDEQVKSEKQQQAEKQNGKRSFCQLNLTASSSCNSLLVLSFYLMCVIPLSPLPFHSSFLSSSLLHHLHLGVTSFCLFLPSLSKSFFSIFSLSLPNNWVEDWERESRKLKTYCGSCCHHLFIERTRVNCYCYSQQSVERLRLSSRWP